VHVEDVVGAERRAAQRAGLGQDGGVRGGRGLDDDREADAPAGWTTQLGEDEIVARGQQPDARRRNRRSAGGAIRAPQESFRMVGSIHPAQSTGRPAQSPGNAGERAVVRLVARVDTKYPMGVSSPA
jgi:hypothetical protein